MDKRLKIVVILALIFFSFNMSPPAIAESLSGQRIHSTNLTPSNTAILSNKFDARFSQDFSVTLKHLRLEWLILDSENAPDSIMDKNLIIIGHPDSVFTGQWIQDLLTEEETLSLQAAKDQYIILEKESPWMQDRTIYICSGDSFLKRRNATEELMRTIMAHSPPDTSWVRNTYDFDLDKGMHDDIARLQYRSDVPELPSKDLMIDMDAKTPRSITTVQAADDIERLFYLFSHGYSGYAFFNQNDGFEMAKKTILQELSTQSTWSGDAIAGLVHEHLGFITDRHLKIGQHAFAGHSDFWYDTDLEMTQGNEGYQFEVGDETYLVTSINNADPSTFIFPSLNRQGLPIYRLGLLSMNKPPSLSMTADNADKVTRQFEIKLQRSAFDYYSGSIISEEVIGGIPVVRIRSFSDMYSKELNQFVATANKHRGTPVVIVDLRGNGGGNEYWSSSWIQKLTGKRPESVFVFSELESATSMIGRANAFAYWRSLTSDPSLYQADAAHHIRRAEEIGSGAIQAGWTGPSYPEIPLIANDTTVVVVINNLVASAGEGFVLRISQAENVVVVGENSMGALTFGNISMHQLPYSKLTVWLPINFNLFTDLDIREEVGLAPDLWVPAEDAVNYAVAAIRNGTINPYQPLPETVLETRFIPESPFRKFIGMVLNFQIPILLFGIAGAVWAFFMRKKERMVLSAGCIWFIAGLAQINLKFGSPLGYAFLIAGIVPIIWGGINVLKNRSN